MNILRGMALRFAARGAAGGLWISWFASDQSYIALLICAFTFGFTHGYKYNFDIDLLEFSAKRFGTWRNPCTLLAGGGFMVGINSILSFQFWIFEAPVPGWLLIAQACPVPIMVFFTWYLTRD